MVQHCQTFLWGGEGLANVDDVSGDFTCECEGELWSDTNILGRPSCIPTKAHVIFGTVGVASSIVGICHAAYQLNRQVSPTKRPTVDNYPQDGVPSQLVSRMCVLTIAQSLQQSRLLDYAVYLNTSKRCRRG